ncbi:MAG: ATP-binding protein [Syntrophobacteraceae bacterium]|nr:ATP-binding protein [Syntrophobacteraceae bacterium]
MDEATLEATLKFRTRMDHLCLATALSRLICASIKEPQVDSEFAYQTELAVSEACTNAIEHGLSGKDDSKVTVVFQVFDERLVISVADEGNGFDLAGIPNPDFPSHPERGYGLFIIRSVMDEVDYIRGEGRNTLVMSKRFRKRSLLR